MTDYLKLTAYFGERLRHRDRFLADAMLDLYGDRAVATSVVLRGIASFGPHHVLRTDQSLSMSEDSPIAVAAVDTADKMAGLADQVVCDGGPRLGHAGTRTARRVGAATRCGEAHHLRRPPGPCGRTARRTARCAICCTDSDSQARQCFSVSTAPRTVSGGEPASSAATSVFR